LAWSLELSIRCCLLSLSLPWACLRCCGKPSLGSSSPGVRHTRQGHCRMQGEVVVRIQTYPRNGHTGFLVALHHAPDVTLC
jgi:hypothetical protein